MDALEVHYDVENNRYRKAMTDKRVADKLVVPWGWVRDVRVQFFGEGDGNESDENVRAQIASLKAELESVRGTLGRLEGAIMRLEDKHGR